MISIFSKQCLQYGRATNYIVMMMLLYENIMSLVARDLCIIDLFDEYSIYQKFVIITYLNLAFNFVCIITRYYL